MIFGIDISHHQGANIDFARVRREGVEFVVIKSTEGNKFVDSEFAHNLAKARAAGLLVAAYHYVRGNVAVALQISNVVRTVPRDVPVIPDVEAGSGGVSIVRDFVNQLRDMGYSVPFSYIPRWYWQQLGSPSLVGLPPLWSSRYPDNVIAPLADEWRRVPASYWNGYGGLDVGILQFTSSASVAGHQPLDANAFRGTREELQHFFTGRSIVRPLDPQPDTTQEEDMRSYYAKGDSKDFMPAPHDNVHYGDLVFYIEATAEGLRRRHIHAEEWECALAGGAKLAEVSHEWLDSIPGADGKPVQLFPWESPSGGPIPGEPQTK